MFYVVLGCQVHQLTVAGHIGISLGGFQRGGFRGFQQLVIARQLGRAQALTEFVVQLARDALPLGLVGVELLHRTAATLVHAPLGGRAGVRLAIVWFVVRLCSLRMLPDAQFTHLKTLCCCVESAWVRPRRRVVRGSCPARC